MQLAATAAQAVQQQQAAEAQASAQAQANAITRQNIIQNQDQARMDAERQRSQEYTAAAAEANQYASKARSDLATFDTLLGEGAGGVTAQRKVASLGVQQGDGLATIQNNSTMKRSEISLQEAGAITQGNQQIASIRPVDRPSSIGTALTIAGAGIRYGQQMDAIKNPKSPYRTKVD